MQTMEAIRARRSVRKYKAEAVPREQIERLLEAAMLAPSAVNSRRGSSSSPTSAKFCSG